MTLRKSILVILSLVLCFSLFSQQADYAYEMDYDDVAVVFNDAPQVGSDDKLDFNDPVVIPLQPNALYVAVTATSAALSNLYISPPITRFLRPPLL